MTEPVIVERLLSDLGKLILRLERYRVRPIDDLIEDEDSYSAVERVLEVAAQCCIDIASHIISDDNLREPESYADTFTSLCEGGVLPRELASKLEAMAKFRNLLVHMYARIDPTKVYDVLQTGPADLAAFVGAIRTYLRR